MTDEVKFSTFEEELLKNKILVYPNVGDSMMPLLREHRDLVIIERPSEWDAFDAMEDTVGDDAQSLCSENPIRPRKLRKGDVPLYKRDNGRYVLHRVLRVRATDYVICGDNRFCCEYGICDRHVIGIMTGIIRDGETIRTGSLKYRLYTWRIVTFYPIRLPARRILHKLRKLMKRFEPKPDKKREAGDEDR